MNKAILIGNLTKDPELKTLSTGVNVCTFSVAINRKYVGADGNRPVDFFTINAWRQLGENCAKFLKKGSKVAISGEIQTRSYDATDGSKRYVTEIVADEVEFLNRVGDAPVGGMANSHGGNPEEGMQPVEDDSLPF